MAEKICDASTRFYVVDDLRLSLGEIHAFPQKVYFRTWQEALTAYRQLPQTGIKSLGACVEREAELVRCVPIFPTDREGEDVLVVDGLAEHKEFHSVAQEIVDALRIRYCLDGTRLLPALKRPARKIRNARLWARTDCIRWVYVAGTGWLSRNEFEKRYPKEENSGFCYPLVLKYQVEAKTRDGRFVPMEVTPWDYKRLKRRTEDEALPPHPARRAEDKIKGGIPA